MEIREARDSDVEGIEAVANASMKASYDFLDESAIDSVTAEWYDPERAGEELHGDHAVWKVAVDDGDVRGFVQATVLSGDPIVGEVDWLHVHPDARGEELGVQLLGGAIETVEKRGGALLRGLVLDENDDGTGFYEAHDFERVDERPVDVGDEQFTEAVYEKRLDEGADLVEAVEGDDGERFVAYAEGERGLEAPFYPAYETAELEDQQGWFCSNCGATETTMDSSGRIKCQECGNVRKAKRWDDSYL